MDSDQRSIGREERCVYAAMILAGTPPVIGTLAGHASFGGGVSLCLGMVALGLVGLASHRRR